MKEKSNELKSITIHSVFSFFKELEMRPLLGIEQEQILVVSSADEAWNFYM